MKNYEKIPSSSFQSICRACLMHSELFPIHGVHWEGISLKEIIQYWTPLQFTNEQLLPQNMCKDCIKRMYQTYNFMSKCKSSEKVLKNILLKESHEDSLDNSILETISNDEENESIHIDGHIDNNLEEDGECIDDNLLNNEVDNCFDVDDLAEVKIEASNIEENTDTNPKSNIINKIQSIKNEISKIRVKNKVKLRQMSKARLVNYSCIPKSKRRTYEFRKGPIYNCITCDAIYETHEEFKKHEIESKHNKSLKFKCQYCHRYYNSYSRYKAHVPTHTGEKPNKCRICGRCFSQKNDLKRHTMVIHMKIKPYKCRFCKKRFSRSNYVKDHERKHTGELSLCPFCGKCFHSKASLYSHEKTHKGHPTTVQEPMAKDNHFSQCDLCGKVLSTYENLKAHMLLHGPKNFSCEFCEKTYPSKQRLTLHIGLSHPKNKFPCHLCDKQYMQKNGLTIHLKSHYGQNDYLCRTCGKQFACKGSLYQHNRIHTGDTTYQCKECSQICINKRSLETHMRTHTGDKPFACEYCGKLFAHKSNMMTHLKIHTRKNKTVCKLCDKSFFDTRGLKRHLAIHVKNADNGKKN